MVSVGRLVPRKGQVDLVRAWPQVLVRHPVLIWWSWGRARTVPRLQRLVRRLGLADSVHLVGRVPDVVPYLAAGDVFASPSRSRWWGLEVEAFGIVYAEAAAIGLTVAGAGAGGTLEAKNAAGTAPSAAPAHTSHPRD